MSKESQLLVKQIEVQLEAFLKSNKTCAQKNGEIQMVITKYQLRNAMNLRYLRDPTIEALKRELQALPCVQQASFPTYWDTGLKAIVIHAARPRELVAAKFVIPAQAN